VAPRKRTGPARWLVPLLLIAGLLSPMAGSAHAAPAAATAPRLQPTFKNAAAFDVTAPLRDLARQAPAKVAARPLPPERGPTVVDRGFSGDGAVQATAAQRLGASAAAGAAAAIAAPSANFEGLANRDNPFLVSPPDPVGDVGPNHYVEMVNLVFAVYSKTGTRLLGPLTLGTLWAGFEVPDCTDLSGDPVVLYDQLADRWILTQFTTRGPTFFNCVAVSTSGDPTGSYFRYAFSTGVNFPDYPKYGVWPNAWFLSTREFAPDDSFFGVGAYALERSKMIQGNPAARMVQFVLPPGNAPYLPGDGLLPSDLDGSRRPPAGSPNFFVGTQDDGGPYGAPFDAINVFQYSVTWGAHPTATFVQSAQIPVAGFDSIFPCNPPPDTRDCIPQPGTTNKLDILSYRQRPTWRLAYRNFGSFEALVTNQSVEARPGIAGMRWYEIRRPGEGPFVFQQGTYAPDDGTHRWMGSVAMDRKTNMAAGSSVSSSTVFPGIRYTGRLKDDPAGQLPLGEAVLIDGSGSQLGPSSRWGDYTSLNVDPDDCTFWYVNEYYQTSSAVGWQTRIGSFRLPGCTP
jgi:hypothetical protein